MSSVRPTFAQIVWQRKLSLSHFGFVSFPVIPSILSFQLQQDFVGVKYPRLNRISQFMLAHF